MTIRHYKKKDVYGVILPRGGGVKYFETEKDARTFVLASTLFEDVEWPSDEPEAIEEPEPTVAPTPEEETTHTTTEDE